MINKVTLIGNLGKDPELRLANQNGTALANVSLATSESYKDKSGQWQDKTEWHRIVFWGKLAERAESTLKKGSMVYVEGKLTHRTYEVDGLSRTTTEVVASYFRVLPTGGQQRDTLTSVKNQAKYTTPSQDTPVSDDDNIPF